MSSFARHLRLLALLVLLAAALPLAQPAHAQTFTVNSTADTLAADCATTCTLRTAITLANANPGPDTITFNISGTAIIDPATPLPDLSGGETTISVSPAHSVVLRGINMGSTGYGLRIVSANNVVRGLVIVGFPGSNESVGGSGIWIMGATATGNLIANNYIGLNADGTTTFGSTKYGVLIDEGASNNTVGGTSASDRNVITGNKVANVGVIDTDAFSASFINNNQVVGNYIGVNAAGTAVPGDVVQTSLTAGVFIGAYARGTLIKGNLIGGHLGNSTNEAAGIVLEANDTTATSTKYPVGTKIVGNDIGVTPSGGSIPNHHGIRILGGALDTEIGDPADPVGGRNAIGNAEDVGILIADSARNTTGTKIVGNYIGIARNGTTLAPIGTANSSNLYSTAILLGKPFSASTPAPAAQIGPANVIAAARRFGIRIRSSQNVVKGNFIGTNVAGTSKTNTSATDIATLGTGFGSASVWVENGSGNIIGGPAAADRNVIAAGDVGDAGFPYAVLVAPGGGSIGGCGSDTCAVSSTTVQGNYIGVSSTGSAALESSQRVGSYGVLLTNGASTSTAAPTGNIVRGNVISGLGTGISIKRGVSNSIIDGNLIGTRASGVLSLSQAIRNQEYGISLITNPGSGNQITNNTIAYNGANTSPTSTNLSAVYAGIYIDNLSGGGDNNTISGNTLVGNGTNAPRGGVWVNGPTGILITKTTTSDHGGNGIRLTSGGNNGLAAPTLGSAGGTQAAATLTGTSSCNNCTVEVFTSPVSESGEGPLYLSTGTTNGSGGFTVNITGCQRYLTATVRDAGNNTSPFSAALDSGGTGPCVDSTFTLSASSQGDQLVLPGSSATYSHSITNNAPVARTFTVVYGSSKGWASGPNQVTVPASSSASFDVTVAVPFGATAGDKDITTVQAFAGPTGSTVRTDTTTVKAVANNPANPAVSPGQTKARSGTTLTFTHSVTNTGDLSGNFSVTGPTGAGTLPTFVGTPPAGWSITSATLGTTTLAGGASTTLTIVVDTPAGAPAVPVQFSFRVKADNGNQSSTVTDTITIPVARSFTFTATNPTGSPPTRSSPPGASVDFVYTLTNTGNASDTFQVPAPANASPLSFSIAPSGSFSLAPSASRAITLTAQVAPGNILAGNYDFSVTAQAVGGSGIPTAPAVAGRVSVTGGGAPQLSFGAGAPNPASASGDTVSFTGILTNTGNASAPFTLGAPSVTGSPAGWSAAVAYDKTCSTPISLAAGASCTFTLNVTVPSGANGGPQAVTLGATADNSGQAPPASNVTVNATATVNVAFVRGVSLSVASPSATQVGAPGSVLTFTHTLTNLGNAPDSFTISFTPSPPATAGMAVLNPTSLTNVPRNGTRTVTLVVTVPSGVTASTNLDFQVAAVSQADAGATAGQTDTATVQAFDGAALSPGTSKGGLPGATVTFTHTLTNTGSTAIAYDITANNSQAGFDPPVITSANPTAVLNPGETTTVTVQVTLPTSLPGGTANTTTLEVRKAGDATLLASADDQSLVGNTYDVLITPDRSGTGFPNQTLVFTHTVTNIGTTADTYILTATNAIAWPMTVTPSDLTLAPGASQVVTVVIDVPNDDSTLVGAQNFGRIQVASTTNAATAKGEATETITIGKVIDLELTGEQARAVTPSSGTIRMRDLVLSNFGNGSDTVDLSVLGADGGWVVGLAATDFLGARDTDYNVAVTVKVPTDVQPGPTKVITIRAQSRYNPAEISEVRLRFAYIPPEVPVIYNTHLPLIAR